MSTAASCCVLSKRMRCRKTEVMSYLESAGFSRANPYYVVQQGKVRPGLALKCRGFIVILVSRCKKQRGLLILSSLIHALGH